MQGSCPIIVPGIHVITMTKDMPRTRTEARTARKAVIEYITLKTLRKNDRELCIHKVLNQIRKLKDPYIIPFSVTFS